MNFLVREIRPSSGCLYRNILLPLLSISSCCASYFFVPWVAIRFCSITIATCTIFFMDSAPESPTNFAMESPESAMDSVTESTMDSATEYLFI